MPPPPYAAVLRVDADAADIAAFDMLAFFTREVVDVIRRHYNSERIHYMRRLFFFFCRLFFFAVCYAIELRLFHCRHSDDMSPTFYIE